MAGVAGTSRAEGPLLDVASALDAIATLLELHRADLDALNVFPVPDADTGTNVVVTLGAARAAVVGGAAGQDPGRAATEAAVRAARGNSGALLAQVLRALLDAGDDVLAPGLADRLARADELARAAVADPVEGSLLTASAAAADAARTVAADDVLGQLRAARDAAHAAVRDSPTRNEVLARAGVVDAGARALALLLDALVARATGTDPEPPAVHVPRHGPPPDACAPGGGRYEVTYLLERSDLAASPQAGTDLDEVVTALRARLVAIGDSVAVIAGREVVSVHVHTDDIGGAVEAGFTVGAPSDLRVEDLDAAVEAATGAHVERDGQDGPTVLVGAAAQGLRELVTAHGGRVLPLDAGEWSTSRLAAALGVAAAAGPVLLLPGRGDVCAAAGEAAGAVAAVVDGHVEVVDEAAGPGEVVVALAVLDPSAPDRGELAAAVEAAQTGRVRVHGLSDPHAAPAVIALAGRLGASLPSPPELVTLLLGPEFDAAATAAMVEDVATAMPDVEVQVLADAVAADVHVVVE